jgi:CheY-like chemotaxis protein
VLIVDDEPVIRTILRRCLGRAEFDVLEAGAVAPAIEVLRGHEVDLLLTDLQMPGGNGTELIAWAQANRPGLPILCISAYADDVALNVPVLPKPFSAAELIAMVSQLLAVQTAA